MGLLVLLADVGDGRPDGHRDLLAILVPWPAPVGGTIGNLTLVDVGKYDQRWFVWRIGNLVFDDQGAGDCGIDCGRLGDGCFAHQNGQWSGQLSQLG